MGAMGFGKYQILPVLKTSKPWLCRRFVFFRCEFRDANSNELTCEVFMLSKIGQLAIATGLFGLPLLASAATAVCDGPITYNAQHSPGHLVISVGGGPTIRVCSFNEPQYSISAAGCKHMAAIAMMALATGKRAVLYVDNAPSTSCATIPNWHISDTRYLYVGD